eukprot:3936335-Rhodomonas_salina.2
MLAQYPPVDSYIHSLPGSILSSPEVRSTGAVRPALRAHRTSVPNEPAATPSTHPPLKAIIFDKDGTLISFDATWCAWADSFIDRVGAQCGGEKARQAGKPSLTQQLLLLA